RAATVSANSSPTAAASTGQPPEAVPSNRGPEVQEGFRGDVHPLLHGRTSLTATADPVGAGLDIVMRDRVPAPIYSVIQSLNSVPMSKVLTERDLSVFLPQKVEAVGQVWALDPDKVIPILEQFHPRPSLRLVAKGRRAGPDGAFAVLRASSDSH